MVEAELRKKETENRHLREQLEHLQAVNNGLMHDMYGGQMVPGGPLGAPTSTAKPPVEHIAPMAGLKEITLGRGTGGFDDDKIPGDEAFQVVLEPRDVDGHTVKVPGTLQVNVLEIKPEGMKVQIGSWEVPPDKLRKNWKSGFMTTGYVVVLPWQKWPTSTKLRVVARFILPDGRVFEADKDVTIRPPKMPPGAKPVPGPMPIEEHGPSLGPDGEPAPRPVEGFSPASRQMTEQVPEPPPVSPAVLWQTTGNHPAVLGLPVAEQ
jgi:hypothetical protein